MSPIDKVLDHFTGVESNGSGWKSLCPAHDDENPSLSIDVRDNGRVLLYCHAGCPTDRILDAAGLDWSDLYPEGESFPSNRRKSRELTSFDLDFRHRVYSTLLRELELHPADHHDLLRRGLSDDSIRINGYKSAVSADLYSATGGVLRPMFRDLLASVPGFHHDGFSVKPVPIEGLFIPIRDGAGRIYALEVRTGKEGKKYQWFSTRNGESSSGQPVHVPLSFPEGEVRTVRVTEGPLKADVASHLDPTVPILAVASVGAWSQILPTLKTLNPPDGVRLAFDSDWHRKPQVRQQMADFWSAMEKDGLKPVLEDWNEWDGKGVDDLLLLGKKPRVVDGSEESTVNHVYNVLAHFRGVESNGLGWKCFCPDPHHDGHQPGLSIDVGEYDVVLINCKTGCPTENVLEAAGLTWNDLWAVQEG